MARPRAVLPWDHALDIAQQHVRWARRSRLGWLRPAEAFEALDAATPSRPVWDDVVAALARAWLETQEDW